MDIPRKRTALLVVSLVLTVVTPWAQAQVGSFDWAVKPGPGANSPDGAQVAVDGQASTILGTGKYGSTSDGQSLSWSSFIKLSPEGTQLRQGTNALPNLHRIVSDSAGEIYAAGAALNWRDRSDALAHAGLPTEGTGGVYLAKLAPDATIQWVRRFGPDIPVSATLEVCFDSAGNYYGVWTGRDDMPEGREFTVAKYDSTGRDVWSRQGSIAHYLGGSKLAATPDGGLLIAGTVRDSSSSPVLQLGDTTLSSSDYSFGFILKLDSNGNLLWAVQPEGVESLASDKLGNAYIAYELSDNNPCLAKYSPSGERLWARQGLGSSGFASISPKLALDDAGNCYFVGTFWRWDGKMQFGDIVLSTTARAEMFLVKYSTDGDLVWATQSRGMNADVPPVSARFSDTRVSSILPSPKGGAVLIGKLLGTVRFGDKELVGPGASGPAETFAVYFSEPPPLPALQMARSDERLLLSWAATAQGFRVQLAETLSAATAWNSLSAVPVLIGDRYTVSVPIERAPRFFRLVKP